jgi:hypothetical protein
MLDFTTTLFSIQGFNLQFCNALDEWKVTCGFPFANYESPEGAVFEFLDGLDQTTVCKIVVVDSIDEIARLNMGKPFLETIFRKYIEQNLYDDEQKLKEHFVRNIGDKKAYGTLHQGFSSLLSNLIVQSKQLEWLAIRPYISERIENMLINIRLLDSSEVDSNRKEKGTTKLKWKGDIAKLVSVLYSMSKENTKLEKFYFDCTRKELKEFIVNNFVDEEGLPPVEGTVSKTLNPNEQRISSQIKKSVSQMLTDDQ